MIQYVLRVAIHWSRRVSRIFKYWHIRQSHIKLNVDTWLRILVTIENLFTTIISVWLVYHLFLLLEVS